MEKLEISLTPELMRRIDDVVELLGFGNREELVLAAVLRFIDRCKTLDIRA